MFHVTTFDIRKYICDKRYDINFSIRFVKNMFTLNDTQESFQSTFRIERNECE